MRPIAGTLHLQTLAGVTNVSSNPSCQRNGASKSWALGLVFAETIPTACSLWERTILFVPVNWTRWEGRYSPWWEGLGSRKSEGEHLALGEQRRGCSKAHHQSVQCVPPKTCISNKTTCHPLKPQNTPRHGVGCDLQEHSSGCDSPGCC